ncbi:unnamed protein product [Cladocopium goreaui]|uniref:J domain-containing protein n=1 Tax=Cladocopium goreaui TaxID=2562237 RepID=A0A9P1CM58_9DINO|nr:unnamed protein product [Cladocopium goreaui]
MRHDAHKVRFWVGYACMHAFLFFLPHCWEGNVELDFVSMRTWRRRVAPLNAFFQGDGFRPDETIPFSQSSTNDETTDGKRNKRKGGVDEIDEDSDVFNTGVFNPYEILDLSPMDEIGEDELRTAFRKQAKIYHPDVPKTGDAEKFQLIKKAVEELASLGMLGEWRGRVPSPRSQRKERGQTVSEDYWELRGRDFFAELETELTDELKMRFNESDKDLTMEQIRGRRIKEDEYWAELQIRQADKKVLERVEDWIQQKREQRRLLLRERLRGSGAPETERSRKASLETLQMVEKRIAQWLGLPSTMLSLDMTLDELGFFDAASWDDVAVCLMLLEEEFEKNIVNIVEKKGQPTTVQLPSWVETVEDFADFVENKL